MPYSNIAESLLEMHYLHVLVRRYKCLLGGGIQIFKPATTAEHWYGFDQAYFIADIPKPEVIHDLRRYIQSNASPRFTSFRAFLLQFKVVEVARKRSALAPAGWKAPYYRSELYLEPNEMTGISQHESLRRLSGLAGASVAYVCPMIFEENDVLNQPKLSDLRFVDVSSSPVGWLTTQRHFIAFQNPTSPPTWCSKPVQGRMFEFDHLFEKAKPLTAEDLFEFLARLQRTLLNEVKSQEVQIYLGNDEPNILPACLSIVAETSE